MVQKLTPTELKDLYPLVWKVFFSHLKLEGETGYQYFKRLQTQLKEKQINLIN
jgi:hypothetical protein